MDETRVIERAIVESAIPREEIAHRVAIETSVLDAILDNLDKVSENSPRLSLWAIGAIMAASGNRFSLAIIPEKVSKIAFPERAPRTPRKRQDRDSQLDGRTSMVDEMRSTEQGRATLDGFDYPFMLANVATNLIAYLYGEGEDIPFGHWDEVFEGDVPATLEDVRTLVRAAGGQVILDFAAEPEREN